MKKVFFIVFFFSFFPSVFAAEKCNYLEEIDLCLTAENPRSVEEVICPTSKEYGSIVTQVVLDTEFKKIDEEVAIYIEFLEKNKNYYFGPQAKKTYPEAVDDIWNKFDTQGYFGKKYLSWCQAKSPKSIVSESLKCAEGKFNMNNISNFFNETTCTNLVKTKLEIYKEVSFQILKLNKNQIKKDTYKTVMQDQRGKYDRLIDMINVNLSFIEKIWARVPYLVKDAK